ncbi:sulfotransferase 1B1 isoform X1 [Hydra vulgaris]|uniref:Sulfotransferase 1B1 isoform X1 n=1 Tax=Hydra vulgaris TaxID=6087 RepID=A0ABM4C346_HYDVU
MRVFRLVGLVRASHRYQIQEDIIVRRWLPPDFVENAISYQATCTDTFIVGYPRAGSSWISYIIYLLKNEGEPIHSSERLWEEIPEIGMGRHVAQRFGKYFVQLAEMVPHPRILRTHLPYDKVPIHPKAKCIYISRNPFDTAVSLFHEVRSINEFSGSFNDFFTYFLHGQTDYNDYFDHHKSWYQRKFEQTVLWVTYEDLMTYPRAIIKQIADYMGGVYQRSANDEFIMKKIINNSSFKEMREKESLLVQKNPNRINDFSFFRKGQIHDFENFFNEEQVKKLTEKFLAQFKGSKLLNSWERYCLPVKFM